MEPRLSQLNFAAIASGDFTNIATNNAADGIYTIDGAPVAIGDIIDLDHGETNIDPVLDIDAGGIKCRDSGGGSFTPRQIAINTPLLTSLLTDGFTALCEFDAQEDLAITMSCHDDEFNFESRGATTNQDPDPKRTRIYDKTGEDYTDLNNYPLLGQVSKLAVTIAADRVSASINGSAVIVSDFGGLDPSQASIVFTFGAGENSRFQSFSFYEVLVDADLPQLSDCGYPILTVVPVITGTSQVGQTVSCSTGTWTHAGAFTYQWFADTTLIVDETGSTYEIGAEYEGFTLSCVVRSTNGSGFATAIVLGEVVVPL